MISRNKPFVLVPENKIAYDVDKIGYLIKILINGSTLDKNKKCRVSGIILAAGKSTRMGRIKALLPFRGKNILECIISHAQHSLLEQIIIVLGFGAEQIQKGAVLKPASIIINKDYEQGQSTSLKTGLSAVSEKTDAVLFILGDQPLISSEVINSLIDGYQRTRAPFVIPVFEGKRGNPVLIDRTVFHRINSLSGDTGARRLFNEYADRIAEIDVKTNGILFDLDDWDDYQALKELGSR